MPGLRILIKMYKILIMRASEEFELKLRSSITDTSTPSFHDMINEFFQKFAEFSVT